MRDKDTSQPPFADVAAHNGVLPPPPRWVEVAICSAFVLAAFLLRFHGLATADLTEDEAMSTGLPYVTYGSLFTDSAGRPPLVFLLQKVSMDITGRGGPFEIRLPSVIEGALGILALYLFAREVLGSRVAFVSALLLCLNHFHFFWSRDGRYYPMLTLMGILFLWSYWGIVERQRLVVAPFALLTGLALILTHYVGLLLLVATAVIVPVFLLSRHWRSVFWFHRPAILIAAAATVIVAVITVPIWDEYVRKAFDMAGRNSTAALPAFFDITPYFLFNRFQDVMGLSRPFTYVATVLMLFGFLWTSRHQPRLALLWFSTLSVPFAILWFFRPSHWWHPKYFIFMLPVLEIMVACGIVWLTTVTCRILQYVIQKKTDAIAVRAGFLTAWGVAALICIPNVSAMWKDYKHPAQDMQRIATMLAQDVREGDRIRFSWLETLRVLRNYYPPALSGDPGILLDPTTPLTWPLDDVPRAWYLHAGKMTKSHLLSETLFSPRLSRMAFDNTFLCFGPNLQHIEFGQDYPGTPTATGPLEIPPGESRPIEVMFPSSGTRIVVVGCGSGAQSLSLSLPGKSAIGLGGAGNERATILEVPQGRSTMTLGNMGQTEAALSFVEVLPFFGGNEITMPAWDFYCLSGPRLLDTVWLEKEETSYVLRDMRSGHMLYYRFFSNYEGPAVVRLRALNDPPGANRYTVSVPGAISEAFTLSFDRQDESMSTVETPPIALRRGVYTLCVQYEGLPMDQLRAFTHDFHVMTQERMQTAGLESISVAPAGS